MNLPPQLQQKIGVSRQQIENAIQLLTAKVAMHQALLDTHIKRDIEERKFWYDLYSMIWTGSGRRMPDGGAVPEPPYLRSLKAHYKAQEDVLRTQLMELQSQLALHEAMLKEAERQIVVAGPGSVS